MIAEPVRGRDAAAQIARGLVASARAAGLSVAVANVSGRPWASATFVGSQVALTLCAPRASALGRWIADLPLAEVAMRGYLLASLGIDRIEDDGAEVRTEVTALVLEA